MRSFFKNAKFFIEFILVRILFITAYILPIKSKLAVLFIEKDSFFLRFTIITFTAISILSHRMALKSVNSLIPDNDRKLRSSINNLLKVELF